MTLGEFISDYRKEHKLSMQALADKSNLSKGYISMLENNFIPTNTNKKITPSVEAIKKLAHGMNVSFEYLLSLIDGDVSWEENKADAKIYKALKLNYIYVPRYSNICCGNGGFADDNVLEFVPVPNDGLNENKEYFCQYASGDSMADMIQDGDLIIFEKCSVPAVNAIGCFCVGENESMCKKFTVVNGVPILKPLNSVYDPVIVNTEDFKCLGILKKIIKTIR